MNTPLGKKEDFGWAVLTAGACALAVKAAETIVIEIHKLYTAKQDREKKLEDTKDTKSGTMAG